MKSPYSTLNRIPLCFVLSLVGIVLACELLHGSVVVTRVITSKPTDLE